MDECFTSNNSQYVARIPGHAVTFPQRSAPSRYTCHLRILQDRHALNRRKATADQMELME